MDDLTGKVDGSTTLPAAEWNQLATEIQNLILDTGQAEAPGDLDQVGKAIAAYASVAHFYTGSGPANVYVLTSVGSYGGPPVYVDGMLIRFRPSADNTGASTVAVDGLTAKSINREDDTALTAADLVTTRDAIARFDTGADAFFLLTSSLFTGPPAETFKADVDVVNNDFTVWQRGTVINSTTAFLNSDTFYCADHVKILSDGNNRAVFSQQGSGGLIGSRYFLRMDAQTTNHKFGIAGILEGSQTHKYRSGVASLSFKTRSTTGLGQCRAMLMTSNVGEDAAAADLVTTWNGENLIITPGTNWSVAGNAIFTPGGTFTQILLENVAIGSGVLNLAWVIVNEDLTHSVNDFLEIGEVQVEPEAAASAFQHVNPQSTLARCQRYFQKTFPQGTTPATAAGVTGALSERVDAHGEWQFEWQFPVVMRASPTIVEYNPITASPSAGDDARDTTLNTDESQTLIEANYREVSWHDASAAGAQSVIRMHVTADAEMP